MSTEQKQNQYGISDQTKLAWANVNRCRSAKKPESLAQAFEDLAGALIKEVDLTNAAIALEEAAQIWQQQSNNERLGNCLILATSCRRLANDLEGAQANWQRSQDLELPERIRNAFWLEHSEQLIAAGDNESAFDELTDLLSTLNETLDADQKIQILQRRAAVAVAIENWPEATSNFLEASQILLQKQQFIDAEACALAAATAATDYDPEFAEQIVTEVITTVPRDGAAAVSRGLVGGRVALKANNLPLALQRFDDARQGAVDVSDPVSYLSAVIYACDAAEKIGDLEGTYSRYARAWVSLANLLDADSAQNMIKPELEKFRDRIGEDKFSQVKTDHDNARRKMRWESNT